MVKVMNYQVVFLDAKIPEKYMTQVKVNQEVKISNYTIPNDTIKGKVNQISPAIDPITSTFRCIIMANNTNLLLKPGMTVNAEIVLSSIQTPDSLSKVKMYK